MTFIAVVLAGLVVGGNGPAYRDWLARRRARRDAPLATVVYLPSSSCRGPDSPSCN